MPVTPQGIYYPDASTNVQLDTVLPAMSNSVDVALEGRAAPYASVAARDATLTSPVAGMLVITTDYNLLWEYDGSDWVMIGNPNFSSTAVRNSAITAPKTGYTCTVGSGAALVRYVHDGSGWRTAWMGALPRRLVMGGTLAVANNTNVIVTGWDAGGGDPGNVTGGLNYGVGYITAPVSGTYIVTFGGFWATNTTGTREMQLFHNGAQRESTVVGCSGGNPYGAKTLTVPLYLNADDTIALRVRQSSGGTLNFGGSSSFAYFNMAWVG